MSEALSVATGAATGIAMTGGFAIGRTSEEVPISFAAA